jgi:hypothetical protein
LLRCADLLPSGLLLKVLPMFGIILHQIGGAAWCKYGVVAQAYEDQAVVQLIEYCPLHAADAAIEEMMFTERVVYQKAFATHQEVQALETMTVWSDDAHDMEHEAKSLAHCRDEAVRMSERINHQGQALRALEAGSPPPRELITTNPSV